MACVCAPPSIDRDALVRCLSFGKGRHKFIEEIEACAAAAAMKTCLAKSTDCSEEHKLNKVEKTSLLKLRRTNMVELWVEQARTLRTWFGSVRSVGRRIKFLDESVGAPMSTANLQPKLLSRVVDKWHVVAKFQKMDR